MDYEQWMERAKEVIETELQEGVKFEVKSLFPGHEWDALRKGERSSFGRYFSSAVQDGKVADVERCENGKTHHNQYVKRG